VLARTGRQRDIRSPFQAATHCQTCRTFRDLSVCIEHTGEPCKTAEPIEMPFEEETHVSARKVRVHVGATLQIQLNDPCG